MVKKGKKTTRHGPKSGPKQYGSNGTAPGEKRKPRKKNGQGEGTAGKKKGDRDVRKQVACSELLGQ